MKPYIYLLGAVVCEVIGTMLLPLSKNFSKPIPSIALLVAYILWIANWLSIDWIYKFFEFSKNLSALVVLPLLALTSYFLQKLFIFKD